MVGKRYVVSDLHGQYDLFMQIKEYINEYDTVYALGDFGDRGPVPWGTLQAVLDDSQFIYLMGNHDYMLMKAIEAYAYEVEEYGHCNVWHLAYAGIGPIAQLFWNGGLPTLEGWLELPQEDQLHYYRKLKQLPLEIRLAAEDGKHFIYLSHAGFTPTFQEKDIVEEFVWDRDHWYDTHLRNSDDLIIHGHSPIEVLIDALPKDTTTWYDVSQRYLVYSGGSKICIDLGAYYTGLTVLVDIDTLESKVFRVREENEQNS